MLFRFKPVQSFEDAQGNFEQLEQLAGTTTFLAASNNLSDVTNKITALKNLGIASGSATATWAGGVNTSNQLDITHGLGSTPRVVLLTTSKTSGSNPVFAESKSSAPPDATQIHVDCIAPFGLPLVTETNTVWWMAIL